MKYKNNGRPALQPVFYLYKHNGHNAYCRVVLQGNVIKFP